MMRAALAFALLVAAMLAFGPRARLSPSSPSAAARPVPDDLEALEAFVTSSTPAGVTPGAEARITWHDGARVRAPWAIVYLHGFSASRQELAPLPRRVAAALGGHLFEVRLEGHGQGGAALGAARAEAWLRDAREAILVGRRLGERVGVLASSTGAALATIVAAADAPPVASYVFFSPNFGLRDASSVVLRAPWVDAWLPLVLGAERSWTPTNEAHGRYWTTRYPVSALPQMMAAVTAARHADLASIRAAIRVFQRPDDPVVDPAAVREVLDRMTGSAKRLMTSVEGPGDAHVLAGDILSPARTASVAADVVAWLRSL